MIQLSSIAARMWIASALVHASVVVAVATGSREGAKTNDPGAAMDVTRIDVVESSISTEEPRPLVTDERVRPPNVPPNLTTPSVPNPSHVRIEAPPHRAKGVEVTGENRHEDDAPPAVSAVKADAPPRFVMAFGTAATTTGGLSKTAESREEAATETYSEAGVSSRARLLEGTPPEYPPAARAAAVEADLPLEIVVDASGAVVDARLLRHAGYGLDEAALRAVRGYRFIPAQRAGRGVSVRMRWVVDFRLD